MGRRRRGRKSVDGNRGVGSGLKPSTKIASQCSGYLTKYAAYRSNYAKIRPVLENRPERRAYAKMNSPRCFTSVVPDIWIMEVNATEGNEILEKIKLGRVVKRDGVDALAAVELWVIFFFYRITFCVLNHSRSRLLRQRDDVENVPVVVKVFEKYLNCLPCEPDTLKLLPILECQSHTRS